jgi:hypothetical protein
MMVVRTNQAESPKLQAQNQLELGTPTSIEDAGSGIEMAEKVKAGKALLEIVSTPWGVEFYVRELVRKK